MNKKDTQNGGQAAPSITFQTTIRQMGNNTGITVPDDVVEQLGSGKRPLVRVTLNDYTYRSSVASMDGTYMISLSKANREAAGVQGGEAVDVTVALDLEPRTVELPADLKSALIDAGALEAFEKAAPSMKKEYVRQVEEAKAQATRERRIAKIVEKLSA
jgi:hypothetical protein